MTDKEDLIPVPKSVLRAITLEIWRLWNAMEKIENEPATVDIKYSVRKIKQILESQGISFIDLTGEVYDAGMSVDIIDTEGEETDKVTDLIIKEMVSPIILFGNKLLTHGQVILEKRARSENMGEGDE